jgi:hypothetical protein
MSYSSKAKNELSQIRTEGRCCNRAVLSGVVRVSGVIEMGGQGLKLRIHTENPAVARLVFILLKKNYRLQGVLLMRENRNLNKNHAYEIVIDEAGSVLEDLGIYKDGSFFNDDLPDALLKKECCRKAYLRGVFLGGGSLSTPEKSYHLELVTHNAGYAERLTDFMNENYDLGAKYTERKNNFIVYIKESEKIVDFLNVIGAHHTLLEYENVRIIKQMRNNINRVINCETANMNKAIDAAYEQVAAIKAIEEKRGIRTLPARLREVAELRMDNPEATLKELGDMLDPPIGKSGVNHRLKKIVEMAERIKEEEGSV